MTTKCPPDQAGSARQVLEQSLELLGLEQVDLWLIHWSGGGAADVGDASSPPARPGSPATSA